MKLPLLAALMLVSLPLSASEWNDIGVTGGSMKIFLDLQSIGMRGGLRKAWTRIEYEKPNEHTTPPTTMMLQLKLFDCAQRLVGIQQTASYGARGVPTGQSMSIPFASVKMADVIPDTADEILLQDVCTRRLTK